jgi:hypothetical protein
VDTQRATWDQTEGRPSRSTFVSFVTFCLNFLCFLLCQFFAAFCRISEKADEVACLGLSRHDGEIVAEEPAFQ